MLASKIISLPIISLYSGELVGTIENLLFCPKQKKCIYIIIYNEYEDIKYALPIKKLYKLGDDCGFIKNNSSLILFDSIELELKNFYNPISSNIYSINCKYINPVIDIELSNNYIISSFITQNTSFDSNKIINFTNKITIYSENKINLQNFKDKKILNKSLPEVNVFIEGTNLQQPSKPNKVIANYEFLLNRITTKDLLKSNGEIIIKKGVTINYKILEKARDNGKMLELTHYSQ